MESQEERRRRREAETLSDLQRQRSEVQDLLDLPAYSFLLKTRQALMEDAARKLETATEGPTLYRCQGCLAGLREEHNKVREFALSSDEALREQAEAIVAEEENV